MKRFICILLVITMLIAAQPVTVLAADDSEVLVGIQALNAPEQAVYRAVASKLPSLAAYGGSTQLTLNIRKQGVVLKIDGVAEDGSYIGSIDLDIKKIVLALLRENPYTMYWYDPMEVVYYGTQDRLPVGLAVGSTVELSTLTIKLPVGKAYRETYTSQPLYRISSKGAALAREARNNADALIEEAMALDTVEQRLKHFFSYIKDNVGYDSSHQDDSNTWQMIWVFDEDEDTNVVCEGYAKAFKYLCDSIGVECYLVTGTARLKNNAGSGVSTSLHMWNVVVLDGNSYLVDITNCDTNGVGAEDLLFMKLPDAGGSVENGYSFADAANVCFTYDEETLMMLGETGVLSLLVPSPEDPEPEDPEPEDPEPEDPKPEDPKPEDPKPEDPKPEDPEPEDPKPEDPEPEDPKPEDPEPEDPEPEDPKPEDPKPEDPEPEDPKPEDPEPEDPKPEPSYVTTQIEEGIVMTVAAPMAELDGLKARVTISDKTVQEILTQMEESESTVLVIKPTVVGDTASVTVSIPAELPERLKDQAGFTLIIVTPQGEVTLPNESFADLCGNGGMVSVTLAENAEGICLTFEAAGVPVDTVNGGAVLRLPCENAAPGTVAMQSLADGSWGVIRKSAAVDGVISVPVTGSCEIIIADNAKEFGDVADDRWYKAAVDFAGGHLLFSGTSDTTFTPDGSMTRGMLAKVLHNLEGNPTADFAGSFPDVDSGAWYEAAVMWAAGERIVTGYSTGDYGPNDDITREQLAVMLWRYCGSPESSHDLSHFEDHGKISAYAREAMAWANENGIINGNGRGQLDPLGKASRAQVAQMLKNLLESLA